MNRVLSIVTLTAVTGCAHEPVRNAGQATTPEPLEIHDPYAATPRVPISSDATVPGPGAQEPPPLLPVPEMAGNEPLDDEKILQVAHVTSEGGVEEARLAEARAQNPAVRTFATTIAADQTRTAQRGQHIARLHQLVPKDSSISDRLQSDAKLKLDELRGKQGADFDRAYVDAQIATYQKVLNIIDDRLLPSATSPEVKALVRSIRPQMKKHYDDAQALRGQLAK
jgi:putative membrane protein